ncbi:MAG: helix-turn-helix domain-containing protein [Anaerolineae bacterium]|jgi:transposase
MRRRYEVELSDEERARLLELIRTENLSRRQLARAHILLRADEGAVNAVIAEALNVHVSTVERVRRRYVTGGLDWALNERSRPGRRPDPSRERRRTPPD